MLPYYREMASQSGPVVLHEDKPVIMLGSNNYLGLTSDDRVKRAAIDAIEKYGTGCTGSRLMNGTLALHRELEEALADWLQFEACLVFTTGYSANVGLVATLVEANDTVFLDSASHASLIDGARMSTGTLRSFRHNLPSSLRQRLRNWRDKHEDDGGALVAVDGIYSMEGDVAPVAEIAEVCDTFGARFLVDEAHALGVLGPDGRGTAAAAGVTPDLLMGTFSKSLASCGGFIAGPQEVIDYLRVACRPLLFTAAGRPCGTRRGAGCRSRSPGPNSAPARRRPGPGRTSSTPGWPSSGSRSDRNPRGPSCPSTSATTGTRPGSGGRCSTTASTPTAPSPPPCRPGGRYCAPR